MVVYDFLSRSSPFVRRVFVCSGKNMFVQENIFAQKAKQLYGFLRFVFV